MKTDFPEEYGKFNEYDFDNRISYDEDSDSMYIYVAPPQGQVGSLMVYTDKQRNMITIDTDEVNTQVGIEIVGKRPGEKTDEDLVSKNEVSRTYLYGDDIHIRMEENEQDNKLTEPYNSKSARKMTKEEMKELIEA